MKKGTLKYQRFIRILPGLVPLICTSVQAATSSSNEQDYIETVTVTGNKIEQNFIDIPQSMTVIGSDKIDENGMKNVSDLLDAVPDLEFSPTSPARSTVNIRGLNSSLFTNNNPAVIYVDGVPYSDSYGFDVFLANVERVEVLRGPQGTLYGKDAIGGVINVVTKEPSNRWGGKVEVEYGRFNYRDIQFNTGGALKDDVLYLDISGQYRADDGWVTNHTPGNESDSNKSEMQHLSASLIYRPTDDFKVKFAVSNDDTDSYGIGGYGLLFTDQGSTSEPLSFSDDFSRDLAKDIDTEFETREQLEISSQALQLTYELDKFTINSVTTHRDQNLDSLYDYDESDNAYLADAVSFDNQDRETWTQELILRSNNDDEGGRYVAGVYFDTEEREQGPYGQRLFGTTYNAESATDSSTAAIFGQFIYPLSEKLELTLGGRYQNIKKETNLDFIVENLPLTADYTSFFSGVAYTMDADKDWSVFLPRAAVTYKLGENFNIYGSVAEGYMPGGFNYFATTGTADDNSFDPQRSTNFEIGLKAQTERMALAAALFYMDIKDIHVWRQDDLGNLYTGNADKAHSQGIEVEVSFNVTREFELSASVGLIDAKYDDYFTSAYDYSGERIEQTPEYTFNFSAAYYHPQGFYARVDLSAAGNTAFYDSGRPSPQTAFPERDAYEVVDARLGYLFGDWELFGYANNVTDEAYVTSLRSSDLGGAISSIVTYNDPRSFGAGARYRF